MATLVLTAVGTAVGGPIGGALGALAGRQIDQSLLFKPAGREGPRIQELAVQTSSYGTQIPRVFGRMRVAGSVIWATDLKETKNSEGGKGRPKTTTYSYSACFAVALSSRPVQDIGRIWADGKIFRGVGGDFKTPTGFRIFKGHEDQRPDGRIVSSEGLDNVPAYRGLAVAVFEDMELADYGNRIPSLTFEIIGDDGSVRLVDIIDDISGSRIKIASQETLHGFAASGENQRVAIEPLADNFLLSFKAEKHRILGHSRATPEMDITNIKPGNVVSHRNGLEVARPLNENIAETKLPRQLALRYFEPARDYQTGLQNSFRPGNGRIIVNRDFPAALVAPQASQIAQNQIWNAYRERRVMTIEVPINSELTRPGGRVQTAGSEIWIVKNYEFRSGAIALMMVAAGDHPDNADIVSDSGRSISDRDLAAGATRLMIVDLPFALGATNEAASTAQLFAVAGGDKGWRNADLYQLQPDGTLGEFIDRISSPGIFGSTEEKFATRSPHLRDLGTTVAVKLHHSDMKLNDADDDQLLAGKNIAIIGKEIIQFGKAKPMGNGRYILSHFFRGLGGTEHFVDHHDREENFLLIQPDSMFSIPPAIFTPFQPARFAALGRDDAVPVISETCSTGIALKPWAPVHLNYRFNSVGDLFLTWTRRSRAGSSWSDHVDIPLAEEKEEYVVSWKKQTGEPLGEETVENPDFSLPGMEISNLRNQGIEQLCFDIRQRGQHTLSEPASLMVPV